MDFIKSYKEKFGFGMAIVGSTLIGNFLLEPKWMLFLIAITAIVGATVIVFQIK